MAIYYLEVDDEITSAAARIRDSSDNRIALVLSGGSRVATSRINFRLLAREAKQRNKRLAIVAADQSVQSVARSADLPVYATVGEYEKAEAALATGLQGKAPSETIDALDELAATVSPAPGGNPKGKGGSARGAGVAPAGHGLMSRFGLSRPVMVGLVGLTIVAFAATMFFFYPSAKIVLTMRQEAVGPITVSVKVDPSVAAANDLSGTVPGLDKAFPVEASGTYDATGQNVVETAATGGVTFSSLNTFLAVPILAGTRVSTGGGVAFVTSSTVTVPKATVSGTTITPGSAGVAVTAVNKGLSGNVAANTIVIVPSDLAASLVGSHPVTNKAATAGGSHTVTPQVVQSDIDKAEADLFSQLDTQFQSALTSPEAVPSGQSLFSGSAHMGTAVCSPDPATLLDQAAPSFQLDCKGTGTATLAQTTNISDLAKRRVTAAVRSGYLLVDNSVTASVGAPVTQGSTVVVPVIVRAVQVPVVDVDALRSAIKGMSVDEATTYLSQFGKVDIAVSPDWASSLPSFDFRIDIELILPSTQPGSSASPGGSLRASASGPTARPAEKTGGNPFATSSAATLVSPLPSASESPPAESLAPSTAPTDTPPPTPGPSPAASAATSPTPGPSPSPAPS
jgi:hypothetical protein